jgi:hypothetical protein
MRLPFAAILAITASSVLIACADEPRGGYRGGSSDMRSDRGYDCSGGSLRDAQCRQREYEKVHKGSSD